MSGETMSHFMKIFILASSLLISANSFCMNTSSNNVIPQDSVLFNTKQQQLHLDKMQNMTEGTFKPKVIMRTSIGSTTPLNGGVQHTNNYTEPLKQILTEVDIVMLNEPTEIFPAFENAYEREGSSLIIEWGDYYSEK